jgi:hypothetical protein
MQSINRLFTLLVPAILLVLAGSCKKERADYPYNSMESFVVSDETGKDLKAFIVGDTITVYWPPYHTLPATITPRIKIAEYASVSPASGTAVSFTTGTTFTVTSETGIARQFKLVVVNNQPQPEFTVVNAQITSIGGLTGITGSYLVGKDSAATKLILIDSKDKEKEITRDLYTSFSSNRLYLPFPYFADFDTGYFRFRVIIGSMIKTTEPFRVTPPAFSITLAPNTTTVKRGSIIHFVLPPAVVRYFKTPIASVGIYSGTTGTNLRVTSFTVNGTDVAVTIPADLAYTQTNRVRFYDAAGILLGQWNNTTTAVTITD